MAAARFILLTGNDRKAAEYRRSLGRYAVKPVIIDSVGESDISSLAARLIGEGAVAVVRETSNIFEPGSDLVIDVPVHLASAENRSEADVWTPGLEGAIRHSRISRSVLGYLDLGSATTGEVFGWDDVFTSRSTGMNYHEADKLGLKASARDMVLAEIIRDVLHFESPVDLRFRPVGSSRPVDFGRSPADHLGGVRWFHTEAFRASPVSSLLGEALQNGVFFRSSGSRRERNYWLPGLNGGVPLVPKKDDIHELTFQFHDLMHAVMPDLVYDGSTGETARRVYMLHRMVGEAVSLVAADAMFVDTMMREGCDYDFSTRRIYPLFSAMNGADLGTAEGFFAAARANTRYALLGDDSLLRSLGGGDDAISAYRGKYEAYFVQDYRWTSANFARMSGEADLFSRWNRRMRGAMGEAHVTSIGDFVRRLQERCGRLDRLDLVEFVDAVFDECWASSFAPAIKQGVRLDSPGYNQERATSRAFLRYVLGQSVMYDRYAHLPAVARMGDLLCSEILAKVERGETFRLPDIARLRAFHEAAVEQMGAMNAIGPEEVRIFKEVVPVFEPFFVFYESSRPGTALTVGEVVQQLFPDTGTGRENDVEGMEAGVGFRR